METQTDIIKFNPQDGKPLAEGQSVTYQGKTYTGGQSLSGVTPTGLSELNPTEEQTPGFDTSKLTALGVTPEQITQLSSPGGMDQQSFSSLLTGVQDKLKYNNDLMDQRALIVKHLFDSPLTREEQMKLPEDVKHVLAQGKDAAELQLRVINDQLQGRSQSLSSSIQALTTGYQTALAQKEQAEGNILQYLQLYGANAVPFLKAKYPEAAETIDKLSTMTTLAEQKAASSGSTTNSNQMTDNERALFTAFKGEPIVKDYNTILGKKLTVDKILDAGLGGPGDLAIVYEFMKALDPTSVVRETEYESAAKSGNIFSGAYTRFNGYFKPEGGFLPDEVKKSFKSIINSKLDVQTQLYKNAQEEYRALAERQGLNPDNVVIDYAAAANGETPKVAPKTVEEAMDFVTIDATAKKAYIPRNVWSQLGSLMDKLVAEAKADGYQLLVTD